jgi:transposase
MRLNRGGNRQLNRAFHVIALAQARHHPPRRRTSSANAPKARPTERLSEL